MRGDLQLLIGLALVAASGCMVGPDYVRPATEVREQWLQADRPLVSGEPIENAAWWTVFRDPVLDQLVEEAYSQNLTLRQAAMRVVQAMAERGIAVGELFPQSQQLSGSYDRSKFSENPGGGRRYQTSWSVGFDAAWELDVWGRFRRSIESADAVLDASLASYDDAMVTLVAEVAATYVDIRTLQLLYAIAVANAGLQEDNLRLAQARFDRGQTSELDVAQAQSALEQTRADIPGVRVMLEQAIFRLDFLLGTPPRDLSERIGNPKEIPLAPRAIAVGIPADLLRRRPDIRLMERLAAAQSALVGVAEADLFPAFSLSGSLGLQSDVTGSLLDSRSWTGNISPGFSWPILNYGRIQNNVRAQDAVFQSAILAYQNSVLAAAQEVESSIVAFVGAQQQVVHLEKSVVASTQALELSRIRYIEGSSTFTRVLNSQAQLRAGQEALANAQGQVAQGLIATYKALGGGWEVRKGMNILPDETRQEMEQRTSWGDILDPAFVSGDDLGIPRHDPSSIETGDE